MSFPRGFPKPALPAAAMALAFLHLTSTAGTTSEEVSQSIRAGLPHYDPAAPKPDAAAPLPAPRAPHILKRVSDPGARIPLEVPKPAGPATAAATAKPVTVRGVLELPKMTVNGAREKTAPLPRPFVHSPERDLPAQPFESPGARTARLIRKHIAGLDQALNRHPLPLIGTSLAAKAEHAEAIEYSATQLNAIADLLELSLLTGTETPEEQKKLRAEYQNALLDRPR